MVYTEPFLLNAGGPRSSTTFLAMELGQEVVSYSFSPAAAISIIYFIIIVTVSWTFKTALAIHEPSARPKKTVAKDGHFLVFAIQK
jgi:glycerol transport system permease protein